MVADGNEEASPIATPDPGLTAAPEIECDPPEVKEEITDVLRKIRKERDRPLFVLISHFLDYEVFEMIYAMRKGVRNYREPAALAEILLVLRAAVRGVGVRQTRSTAPLGAPGRLTGDAPELLHER